MAEKELFSPNRNPAFSQANNPHFCLGKHWRLIGSHNLHSLFRAHNIPSVQNLTIGLFEQQQLQVETMRNVIFTSVVFCSIANAFLIEGLSSSLRIVETQLLVSATASPPSSNVIPKQNFLTAPRPKIEELNGVEDYVDFLEEDDRLCMIK